MQRFRSFINPVGGLVLAFIISGNTFNGEPEKPYKPRFIPSPPILFIFVFILAKCGILSYCVIGKLSRERGAYSNPTTVLLYSNNHQGGEADWTRTVRKSAVTPTRI